VLKLIALYTATAYNVEREMSASACTRFMASYFISFTEPSSWIRAKKVYKEAKGVQRYGVPRTAQSPSLARPREEAPHCRPYLNLQNYFWFSRCLHVRLFCT